MICPHCGGDVPLKMEATEKPGEYQISFNGELDPVKAGAAITKALRAYERSQGR